MTTTLNASTAGVGGFIASSDNSGVLALQTSGTTAITVDASQRVAFVAGTAALPAITTAGDTNTGIFFPAADTIAFSEGGAESMRIDSSGNVGIGTASPTQKLDVNGYAFTKAYRLNADTGSWNVDNALSLYSSTNGVYLNGPTAGWLRLNGDGTNANYVQVNGSTVSTSPNTIQLFTASSERMRINSSGKVLVGTTEADNPTDGIVLYFAAQNSQVIIGHATGTPSGYNYTKFSYNASTIGSITQNGTTAVAYNTSSDYRLKENIAPLTGALNKVSQLKPVTYTWKSAPDETGEGFIAHELAEVCPQAVHGTKDAIDADGNPVYQGIDTSFLVATLTAALQETKALLDTQAETINALTARIVALEGQ